MRRSAALILAWFLAVASTAAAQTRSLEECGMIQQFNQLHQIQTRLSKGEGGAFFDNDIRFLRNHMGRVNIDQLLAATGETARSSGGQAILGLMNQTLRLLRVMDGGGPETIRAHFADPAVQLNLERIRQSLPRWLCPVEGVITMEPWAVQEDDNDLSAPRPSQPSQFRVHMYFNATNSVILLALMAGIAITYSVYRRRLVRTRRRAKRYTTNFPTKYRIGAKEMPGTLLDISGMGTKLEFDKKFPVRKGAPVQVMIFDKWVSGKAVWGNVHYSGILFQTALSERIIGDIREASAALLREAS